MFPSMASFVFEFDRNFGPSERVRFCSHGHSTIWSTTLGSTTQMPDGSMATIDKAITNLNGTNWRTIGGCGGATCVQYKGILVPRLPRMVLQSTWTPSATSTYTICATIKSTWLFTNIRFFVIVVFTFNMCAFICWSKQLINWAASFLSM